MPTITELADHSDSGSIDYWGLEDNAVATEDQSQPLQNDQTFPVENTLPQRDIAREVLDAQIANEREQYQPTAAEKVFAILKSMLLRAMVIYFIMQFFKRPQPNQPKEL